MRSSMGVVPFGYALTERGRLEVAPEEAELVRGIFERIASGSTLYAVAAWLSKHGVPPPSWKYSNGKRPPAEKWLPETVRLIVKNTRYTGTHKITLSTGEVVKQTVPAIVGPELRRRALAQLEESRRYAGGKKGRNYLLRGLVTCEVCGCACVGHTHTARGKKYPYYKCSDDHPLRTRRAPLNHAPYVPAGWLEETVWADVRQFLENPGEVLERVREEITSGHAGAELEVRRTDLEKRLVTKSTEKDRYVHAFARGHISEEELSEYVTDLKNQIDNLRLLIRGVEDELAAKREHTLVAENVEA